MYFGSIINLQKEEIQGLSNMKDGEMKIIANETIFAEDNINGKERR